MALAREINFATLDDLFLDPLNPRLGRAFANAEASPEQVLEEMRDWALEELAISFLESGFWPQEAVIVVSEELYGPPGKLVVVEGNRRLAALKYLRRAFDGAPVSRAWQRLVTGVARDDELFTKIPYILAESRDDVTMFLGFRHVTGIKEWNPAQKAEYIAHLVDDLHLSYEQVMRKIGSKTEPVRRNYIAHRVFRQLDALEEGVSIENVEKKFSVLFLSLREAGVQNYLGINMQATPDQLQTPVSGERVEQLTNFAKWLFGNDESPPLFTDSRRVGDFARVLASVEAVDYLQSSPEPSFDVALLKAGIEVEEVITHIKEATDQVELALSRIHLHVGADNVKAAVRRFALGAHQLVEQFEDVWTDVFGSAEAGNA